MKLFVACRFPKLFMLWHHDTNLYNNLVLLQLFQLGSLIFLFQLKTGRRRRTSRRQIGSCSWTPSKTRAARFGFRNRKRTRNRNRNRNQNRNRNRKASSATSGGTYSHSFLSKVLDCGSSSSRVYLTALNLAHTL